MSDYKKKSISITKAQEKWLKESDISLSRFVQKRIEQQRKAMEEKAKK